MDRSRLKVGAALLCASVLLLAPFTAGAATPNGVGPDGGISTKIGAGYISSPPTGTAVAETSFRVPTITCAHPKDTETLWLGLQAYMDAGATSVDSLYAQVRARCQFGVISYTAFVLLDGSSTSMTVKPGDLIDTYYRENSTVSVVQINDLTTGPQISEVGAGHADFSVLIGQQDLTDVVPTFFDANTGLDIVAFTSSYVNGYLQRYDGYPTTEIRQQNLHVEINTGALNNVKSGFRLYFKTHR
jgi:hypothetical protein